MSHDAENPALEKAYLRACGGPAGYPNLFRELVKHDLYFLAPTHPEIQMGEEITSGPDAPPPMAVWTSQGKDFIPVFTNQARAIAALRSLPGVGSTLMVAAMEGEAVFQAIHMFGRAAVINPAGKDPHIGLNQAAVEALARGFGPRPDTETVEERGRVQVLTPDRFPLELVQPLFGFLQERPAVKAAWIFENPLPPGSKARAYYVIGLLGDDIDARLREELRLVIQTSMGKDVESGIAQLDTADPAIAALIQQFAPFYAAPDFEVPGSFHPDEDEPS